MLVSVLFLNTVCDVVRETSYSIGQQWVFHKKMCKNYKAGR